MLRFSQCVFALLLCVGLLAQSPVKHESTDGRHYLSFDQPIKSAEDYISIIKSEMGLTKADSLHLEPQLFKQKNYQSQKLLQYHNGHRVVGAVLNLHFQEGDLFRANGRLAAGIQSDDKLAYRAWDKDFLKEDLIRSMEGFDYPEIQLSDWTFEEEETVWIDVAYPEYSGRYKQARLIHVRGAINAFEDINEELYVDVETGRLIAHFSNVHFERVKGVANTRYYGEQEIHIDSVSSDKYLLWDRERKIVTLDDLNSRDTFENDSKYWDQVNVDQNEVAGDVHYGASAFYDMMNEKFGWQGIDGQGSEIKSVVHALGRYYVNASWDGEKARFGNGDCDRYNPLVTLDIVGHEFVHGFTDHTSDLVYRNESGALNEAISDIFGKALEYYYDPDFNWLLGDKTRKHQEVNYFRSMDDPHLRYDPKFYGGQFWHFSTSDNGGVHSNSGVLNHWFYLLVEGGSGVNEDGVPYTVEAIGMDKAIELVFRLQTAYLGSDSNYRDAYRLSKWACEDLFGSASSEYLSNMESWKAVGFYNDLAEYDLKLVSLEQNLDFCMDSHHQPEFYIINLGSTDIKSGEEMSLLMKQGNTIVLKEDIVMDDDLVSGDTLLYTLSDPMRTEQVQDRLMKVELLYDSENSIPNNVQYVDVYRIDQSDNDISLQSVLVSSLTECTIGNLALVGVTLRNNGCSALNSGEIFTLTLDSELGSTVLELDLYNDLPQGRTRTYYYSEVVTPEIMDIPNSLEYFSATVDIPSDDSQGNNGFEGEVDMKLISPRSFYTGFDDYGFLDYTDVRVSSSFMMDTLIEISGNRFYALAAKKEHGSYDNCALADDFLNENYFSAEMSICIDTREMSEPVFSFDLMQYRNSASVNPPVNPDFGNIVKVTLDNSYYRPDEIYEELLIYGQNEGDIVHYDYPLPESFEGEIIIDVLCLSANEIIPGLHFLQFRDVALFDNFRIYERGTALTDFDAFDFLIYPNPTKDQLIIRQRNASDTFSYELFDLSGRRISERQSVTGQAFVNMSANETGLYNLVLYDASGALLQTKRIFKSE